MGEIFLARSGQLSGFEKLCVIKKVLAHLSADRDFIRRFVDEAQVAIKLQHVNVAQVFEVGRVGNEYFLALEYVEGRDLRRTLATVDQTMGPGATQTLSDVSRASQSLRALADFLERHPESLLKGKPEDPQ